MELPEGGNQVEEEGGQGAGRVGVEDTQKSQSLLRGSLCAEPTSGGNNCRVPSPGGPPPAHGSMPEGTPFRELCSPTSIGRLAFQSSSVMVSLHHQAGDKGPEKAHGPRPPLPFANEETEIQRGKATYLSRVTVSW